jgi:hypothetical protein
MHSADPASAWSPCYHDCEPPLHPWLFKALSFDDVTLCLDESTCSVIRQVCEG